MLKRWQVTPGSTPMLEYRAEGYEDWFEAHLRALDLLRQVEEHINQPIDDDDALLFQRDQLERIRRMIFVVDGVMNSTTGENREHLSVEDLASLQLIGRYWITVDPVQGEVIEALLTFAADAFALVVGDESLDQDTQEYLAQLISHLQMTLGLVKIRGWGGGASPCNGARWRVDRRLHGCPGGEEPEGAEHHPVGCDVGSEPDLRGLRGQRG